MILSNEGMKIALANGTIGIEPAPAENCIETSAVDLTLSAQFNVWKKDALLARGARVELNLQELDYIGVAKGCLEKAPTDSDGCLVIPPYREHPWLFLAQTHERIKLSHRVAARVEGRSSLARVGLVVHFDRSDHPFGIRRFNNSGDDQLWAILLEARSTHHENLPNGV
jgi:dCTP deaminase